MKSRTFFTAACVLATAIAPSLANAGTTGAMETHVAIVRTSDLNLSSPQGQATLHARIAGAVSRVCGSATGAISMEERRAVSVCRTKARNAALAVARTRGDQQLAQR